MTPPPVETVLLGLAGLFALLVGVQTCRVPLRLLLGLVGLGLIAETIRHLLFRR